MEAGRQPGLLGHFNNNLRQLETIRPSYAPPPAHALSCSGLYIELHLIRGSTATLSLRIPFIAIAEAASNGQTVYICI